MTQESITRIRLLQGDIVNVEVDALVNAANTSLLGGGGVDGAIHRAAGPELVAECRTIGGCSTGEARITGGYLLAARHVIHTVGPVYRDGSSGEPELLRSAYHNSLALAAENGCKTVAFPAISTGVYRYPTELAAQIAVDTVLEWLGAQALPETVTFVLFSAVDLSIYESAVAERAG